MQTKFSRTMKETTKGSFSKAEIHLHVFCTALKITRTCPFHRLGIRTWFQNSINFKRLQNEYGFYVQTAILSFLFQ